jgi:hypothetical protein
MRACKAWKIFSFLGYTLLESPWVLQTLQTPSILHRAERLYLGSIRILLTLRPIGMPITHMPFLSLKQLETIMQRLSRESSLICMCMPMIVMLETALRVQQQEKIP